MGRARRPVYERGPGSGNDTAPQAGRPAGDRDRARGGLPPRPVTSILLTARRGGSAVLHGLFADYLWPSLRRRVALALAAGLAAGYLVVILVFQEGLRWPLLLIPVGVLVLVPWGWWYLAGQLLRPLSATAQTV